MVEIGGFGGRLLQREVPSEGLCLYALVSVTAFSRSRFCWFLFGFFVCFSFQSLPL
jgi:hypothetical protein